MDHLACGPHRHGRVLAVRSGALPTVVQLVSPVKVRDRQWQLYRAGGGRLVHANKRRWYVYDLHRHGKQEVAEAQCGGQHFDPVWQDERSGPGSFAEEPTCWNCRWRWNRRQEREEVISMPSVEELQAQVERLRARADIMEARAWALDEFGEDDFDDEDVLMFKKRFSPISKLYTYAAVKAEGLWYVTGTRQRNPLTWKQLVEFISEGCDELWQCTEFEPIW